MGAAGWTGAIEIYLEQVARSDRTMRCKIERRQWTPGVESFWSIRAQSCYRASLDSVDGWWKVIINRSSLNDSSSSLQVRKVSCGEIAETRWDCWFDQLLLGSVIGTVINVKVDGTLMADASLFQSLAFSLREFVLE